MNISFWRSGLLLGAALDRGEFCSATWPASARHEGLRPELAFESRGGQASRSPPVTFTFLIFDCCAKAEAVKLLPGDCVYCLNAPRGMGLDCIPVSTVGRISSADEA